VQQVNTVIRVDHVGSLLRPSRLRDTFVRHMRGQASDTELRQEQDDAVRGVLAQQEQHGIPIQTDGEFRRRNFVHSVADSVTGLENWKRAWSQRFLAEHEQRHAPGFSAPPPQVADAQPATGRLTLAHNAPLAEYTFAAPLSTHTVKVTLAAPHRVAQCVDVAASQPIYGTLNEVLMDAAAALRGMVLQLQAAGCSYVQLDAPSYAAFLDPRRRAQLEVQGVDLSKLLGDVIRAENAAVAGVEGLTLGLHVCRGNRPGAQWGSGPYDAIAEQLFPSVTHNRLLLEYDTERAGGFEPLRFVPRDKTVVLGVVSTKASEVETVDQIAHKVDQAAKILPLDQLAISPQCGFSSDVGGPPMTVDTQWRKLDALQEAARQIWG
jgi:5-methyltetrahydropteroyltriglutamate--homocysteine methyltransferase